MPKPKEAPRTVEDRNRERTSIPREKISPELREILEKKFPKALELAFLAGCDEFDYFNAAHLLMQLADAATKQLPPVPPVLRAGIYLENAMIRLQEAMYHMSKYNENMEQVHELVAAEKAKEMGGLVIANELEAQRMTGGKLKGTL